MELQGKKINVLGDSITEGCGVATPGGKYWEILSSETGAVVRGYGVSGTRITPSVVPSENPRYDLDYIQRTDTMDADADVVIIFGGSNDYGHGKAPIGKPCDREPNTFYGALHTLYRKVITRYPNALIVVLTPTHRLNENALINEVGNVINLTLGDFVNAEIEVARYYSLPVLDLYSVSGLQPEVDAIRESYMPDGLHPNDAGHKIIASRLINFLKSL